MEILKGYESEVSFMVPQAVPMATFRVKGPQGFIGGTFPVVPQNGFAKVKVPYFAVQEDGDIEIIIIFYLEGKRYEKSQTLTVVTPYLELHEIKKIIESDSDEDAREVESAVRHIINAHCGQNFGKFTGKLSVSGSGDNTLRMPRRLISYRSINNSTYWVQNFALRGGGWFLITKAPHGPPSVRADYEGWHYNPNSGVISAPPLREFVSFVDNAEYVIDGVWGWNDVPEPVRQAAKLLVNDYACGDSLYRDRFITSMTAADWRIQFHDGAFSNTGNVRANQLLAEYVLRRGWVII